jgi:transposase
MAKAGNEARTEFILTELRKGLDRKDILQLFTKSYKVSVKTFDNLLKVAKERLAVENELKEKERQSKISEEMQAQISAEIASDAELDLMLSKIAMGGVNVEVLIKGDIVIRGVEPMEQIAAIDKLYRRRGSYAPTKSAATDTSGKDLPLTSLAPSDVAAVINELRVLAKNAS